VPEASRPSPRSDRRGSRNLFVDADPDLDALAPSMADERAGRAAGRRRGRGLVVLAERHRSGHSTRPGAAERLTRPDGSVAGLRTAAIDRLGRADAAAAAGRMLHGVAARPYRALVMIVAVAGLLVAFSWLVLDVRDLSSARAAADGRLARNAATLRYQGARIQALSARLHQLAQTAPPTPASTGPTAPPDVLRRPAALRRPPARQQPGSPR
jgi:hypothetical protein